MVALHSLSAKNAVLERLLPKSMKKKAKSAEITNSGKKQLTAGLYSVMRNNNGSTYEFSRKNLCFDEEYGRRPTDIAPDFHFLTAGKRTNTTGIIGNRQPF
ncbi:hypothetical protein [Pseudomonas sp. O230]|uniref:hypothetical protein n=1 Tax=Pseudomonas sp. O230 TaxID=3159450 RepID=UPI00387B58F2